MPKIKRALKFVWDSAPALTTIKVFLIIIQGLLPLAFLAFLYLTKLIVDTVANAVTATDKQAAFQEIIFLVAIAGIIIIVTSIAKSLSQLVSTLQSQKVTDYMEGILHDKSMSVDLEYYENAEYYDMLQRAQREAPSLPNQILNRLTEIGQNSISLIAIVGLLLSFHWGIALVLFLVGIPTVLVRLKYGKIMYQWQRKTTPIRRRANYYGGLLTRDRPAKEIRLFNGYDTMLGKLFDQGEQLSIGQWQKIALARAFLRDSQVIVLDEPTSALDPKAEYEVFQKFRQLIKNQAAILISHRLSTVKMADCIYVMNKGSIIESGTHDELLHLGGTYAHLFETQAMNYR